MKRIIIYIFIGFCIFFLRNANYVCAATLDDVKTSILREDFGQARILAKEALLGPVTRNQENEIKYYAALSDLYLGDYQQARDIFQSIVKETSNSDLYDQSSIGIINTYFLEGHYDQVLKKTDQLLENRRDSNFLSLIYLKKARANLRLARWDEARKILRKIEEEFPDSLEAFTAKQLLEEKQYFAVQVGAFLDQNRAEKLVSELKSKGQYGYIVETIDKNGKKFYRVRIGETTSLEKARNLRNKLADIGYPTIIYP
ncbi:MAG: SPOR domain-containing protein [Candidatus Omnitrophica bacterium]|nr:SPOR domain-containing protein [Candidatus Omnitrophota bacterium]